MDLSKCLLILYINIDTINYLKYVLQIRSTICFKNTDMNNNSSEMSEMIKCIENGYKG